MVKLSKDEIIETLGKCLLNVTCPREQVGCYLADRHDCKDQLFDNVVALLKEQEPISASCDMDGRYLVCGNCGKKIGNSTKYCPKCGRAVKRNDSPDVGR